MLGPQVLYDDIFKLAISISQNDTIICKVGIVVADVLIKTPAHQKLLHTPKRSVTGIIP